MQLHSRRGRDLALGSAGDVPEFPFDFPEMFGLNIEMNSGVHWLVRTLLVVAKERHTSRDRDKPVALDVLGIARPDVPLGRVLPNGSDFPLCSL